MPGERTHHRIRFYPGVWSTFDLVEPCKLPQPCMNCHFGHPLCTENGKVAAGTEGPVVRLIEPAQRRKSKRNADAG